jgi:hypothetical protein
MTGERITSIENKHFEGCGKPPQFDFGEYDYLSYFENQYGDQSMFLYDSEKNCVIVYIADAGWDKPQKIPGEYIIENKRVPSDGDTGIMPDSSERIWLEACKTAVEPRIKRDID